MGLEATCPVEIDGRRATVKAHLDKDRLDVRGELRCSIPFQAVKKVEAKGGKLRLEWTGGRAVLELGAAAQAWYLKIRYPRGRLEKLGVKAGQRVAVLGLEDAAFLAELADVTPDVTIGKPRKDTDVLFFAAASAKDLARLGTLQKSLRKDGALWVLRRKGPAANPTEKEVYAAGRAAGLVDIKVVSFSDVLTAEKFVLPVAKR